jgi:hypothetical protein
MNVLWFLNIPILLFCRIVKQRSLIAVLYLLVVAVCSLSLHFVLDIQTSIHTNGIRIVLFFLAYYPYFEKMKGGL